MLQVHRVDVLADLDHRRLRRSDLVRAELLRDRPLLLMLISPFNAAFLMSVGGCSALNAREYLLVMVVGIGIDIRLNDHGPSATKANIAVVSIIMIILLMMLLMLLLSRRGVSFQWSMSPVLVAIFLANLGPSIVIRRSLHSDPAVSSASASLY